MARPARSVQVLIVGSVLFTFISFWRTAAIVLCDLASTAYYIGGIVEQAIGPAAPWFILAVMLFSYAVRSVYMESCSLFVRGGVYRVVKQAMGGFLAKLAVSALLFDYVLTGPISGVSAGQYIIGLILETLRIAYGFEIDADTAKWVRGWGAVLIAIGTTLYFFRQNLRGIHESSEKALRIMQATTVMAVIMLIWCGLTLAVQGPRNRVPLAPTFEPKMNYDKGQVDDPLGFLAHSRIAEQLRQTDPKDPNKLIAKPNIDWMSLVGLAGLLIAFGHSILAMSGEETLAQVYREVESPKMKNFKKAAFIVFVYSILLTCGISFLAVLLIPNDVRMPQYSGNLIGGLAMHVYWPAWLAGADIARLALNAFVVIIGFLILSGAVNTAIIGSSGVLNRVAEDGVIPTWLQKPHAKFGTTYRILYLIVGMQLFTIIASGGDVITLGEAYAFGVVWSFTFNALSMLVLRFTDKSPREAKVPLNLKIGGVELPIGLAGIFLILFSTAIMNLLTKETATIWGLAFTTIFMSIFTVTELMRRRQQLREGKAGHVEQFSKRTPELLTPEALELHRPYRKLVAIRSPHNLHMLEKALAEADPETTDVIVMTAKLSPPGETQPIVEMDPYDQQLMTAVVQRAEKAGKHVLPLIMPTNNPMFAIISTARELRVQELIMGASNKYTAEEQLDQVAFYWTSLPGAEPQPITIRILGRNWDTHIDLNGGARIPTLRERRARNVADLRAAGVGVKKALFYHDGSADMAELYDVVLTLIDEAIPLGLAYVAQPKEKPEADPLEDLKRAEELDRPITPQRVLSGSLDELLDLVRNEHYDLLIYPRPAHEPNERFRERLQELIREAPCRVFVAFPPVVPREVEEDPPMPEPTIAGE